MEKYLSDSIEINLWSGNITEEFILKAFTEVDIEDFIPPQYKKNCNIDIELPLRSDGFMLRKVFLAKILLFIHETNPRNILIISDMTGYTTALCLNLFQNCFIFGATKTALENIRKNKLNCKFISNENIDEFAYTFDAIFFDSKIHTQNQVSFAHELLSETGHIFYIRENEKEFVDLNFNSNVVCVDVVKQNKKFSEVLENTYLSI